jgi:hypothetical protein
MPLQVSEHDDFPLPRGLCPLLRGQEYHASIWGSVTDFMAIRRRKDRHFFRQCEMTQLARHVTLVRRSDMSEIGG